MRGFPCPAAEVALFVASLDLRGYSRASIRTMLSALTYPHKLMGWENPASGFLIRKVKDASRTFSIPCSPKAPITLPLLQCLLRAVARIYSSNEAVVLKASLLAGVFRLSESG
jgi:hypothetical protein